MKKTIVIILSVFIMLSVCSCGKTDKAENPAKNENSSSKYPDAQVLVLDTDSAKLDGKLIDEYDYVWNFTPDDEEPYYSGNKPDSDKGIYIAHDIIYYPESDKSDFSIENYDGENEWVRYYNTEELSSYIFSTLPVLGEELPSDMMHTAQEAYDNPVIHITKTGEYIISGKWNGQILVDLTQDDAFTDKNAKVTLILCDADITCSVAPAIIFKNVYECDNEWESREEYGNDTELSDAGAKVIIADGTENNITGSNVFRILKHEYKKDSDTVQKKYVKTDAAFYSYVSLLIDGEENDTGILNITSTTYEGLDSELHLTVDGGYIHIVSQDDGINVNEDNVSVFTMNSGHLFIFAGQGAEGDAVDSNGYITVNGGFIAAATPSFGDEILDCDCKKIISETATVLSNASSIKNGKMPFEDMPPEGEPPMRDNRQFPDNMTPPDKKPENNADFSK